MILENVVTPGSSNPYDRPEGSSNNHIDFENDVVKNAFYVMTFTLLLFLLVRIFTLLFEHGLSDLDKT